jgi:hypothetical protein
LSSLECVADKFYSDIGLLCDVFQPGGDWFYSDGTAEAMGSSLLLQSVMASIVALGYVVNNLLESKLNPYTRNKQELKKQLLRYCSAGLGSCVWTGSFTGVANVNYVLPCKFPDSLNILPMAEVASSLVANVKRIYALSAPPSDHSKFVMLGSSRVTRCRAKGNWVSFCDHISAAVSTDVTAEDGYTLHEIPGQDVVNTVIFSAISPSGDVLYVDECTMGMLCRVALALLHKYQTWEVLPRFPIRKEDLLQYCCHPILPAEIAVTITSYPLTRQINPFVFAEPGTCRKMTKLLLESLGPMQLDQLPPHQPLLDRVRPVWHQTTASISATEAAIGPLEDGECLNTVSFTGIRPAHEFAVSCTRNTGEVERFLIVVTDINQIQHAQLKAKVNKLLKELL